MTTPVPLPDEPDIYEALINTLTEASQAYREAAVHIQAALPNIHRILELHQSIQPAIDGADMNRSQAVSAQTFARAYQASTTIISGLEVWNSGSQSLLACLELATMMLQAERELQAYRESPDALAG